MNTKIYGVFAYWQQPGFHGCYMLTTDHDRALKLKRRLVKDGYGDYDASGFRVVHDTIENLMLEYTTVSEEHHSGYFTFPDLLKEFEAFLNRTDAQEDEKVCDFATQVSTQVSAMQSTISKLNDCFDDLSISQQLHMRNQMELLQDKIEKFITYHALDEGESSLEW